MVLMEKAILFHTEGDVYYVYFSFAPVLKIVPVMSPVVVSAVVVVVIVTVVVEEVMVVLLVVVVVRGEDPVVPLSR